jgi:hypothetical protein
MARPTWVNARSRPAGTEQPAPAAEDGFDRASGVAASAAVVVVGVEMVAIVQSVLFRPPKAVRHPPSAAVAAICL